VNRRHLKTFILILIIAIIFANFIIISQEIKNSVLSSIYLFIDVLIPSLLPFFVFVDILNHYHLTEFFGSIISKPFSKIFGMDDTSFFIYLFSLISGFPTSTKMIVDACSNNSLNIKRANRLILFCHSPNIIFVINVIAIGFIGNKKYWLAIFLTYLTSTVIIALFTREKNATSTSKIKKHYLNVYQKNNQGISLNELLSNSIINSSKILLNIFIIVTTFFVLLGSLNYYFNFNSVTKLVFYSFFEFTQGLTYIKYINNRYFILLAVTTALSFSGISVHMQVKSILINSKIKYSQFLKGRIIQTIITIPIAYIYYKLLL